MRAKCRRAWRLCGIVPGAIVCLVSMGCARARPTDSFYASAEGGTKLITLEVRDINNVTTTLIGPTEAVGCVPMALSPSGVLYSMCGPGVAQVGPQQLATIDPKTGHATPFGMVTNGLTVMGLEFAPNGTLYAVGDSNPSSPTFNSLYTVDTTTGASTRVGSTGASPFLMDCAIDSKGNMYCATSEGLYSIDPKSGTATKVVDFVGGGEIMGLSFNRDEDKLYATDFKTPNSALYQVDIKTGFLTPVAATGFANAHSLTSASHSR
jgi:DNA-binding beta-propeller fold protein YncE